MTPQVLTPSGYVPISQCKVGDQVCAFDLASGAPIINTIETMRWVDAEEWARWWNVEASVPPFTFFKINGVWTLNSEQSVWRNGTQVCHARDLIIGDVLHDDKDHDVVVTSIEQVKVDGWWRFDISDDHSYIVDGLTLHNASRFWVGGTGTWDSSTTTPWAASSGGAGGNSVPGSADTVAFDGLSGGGTVTVSFGGTITVQSITMGSFTGTWDNSVHNNNVTVTASGNAFSITGTGARTITLGTATYTLSNAAATWAAATTTSMTLTANSSTITFSGNGSRVFNGGSKTYGTLNIGSNTGTGSFNINTGSGSGNTFSNVNITAPAYVIITNLTNDTISNAVNWAGSASSPIGIVTDIASNNATLNLAAGSTLSYCAIRDITFTGSPTATNSFDLGDNSGITITGPSGGGGPRFSAGFV